MSVSDALALAPASSSKTAIDAAADTFVAELDNAVTATHLDSNPRDQLKSQFIDMLEELAPNLSS